MGLLRFSGSLHERLVGSQRVLKDFREVLEGHCGASGSGLTLWSQIVWPLQSNTFFMHGFIAGDNMTPPTLIG